MKEPQYYIFRADLKEEKVMFTTEDAKRFFKTTNYVIRRKALGKVSGHNIGGNIGTKWFIFDAGMKRKDVQEYIDYHKTDNVELKGYQERQQRKALLMTTVWT